jgi:nitroreductase
MDVLEAILGRRSVRSFKDAPVIDESVTRLIEAARFAPSGGNRQPWRFVEVRDPRRINMIKMFSAGLRGDPTLIIAICAEVIEPITLIDIGMAAENIMIEAVELGLGSCAILSFSEEPIKKLLEIPENMKLVLLLSMGFPSLEPDIRTKKTLEEIAYSEKFGKRFLS